MLVPASPDEKSARNVRASRRHKCSHQTACRNLRSSGKKDNAQKPYALLVVDLLVDSGSRPEHARSVFRASYERDWAVLLYADGGWSFGLPGVRAAVGNVISPERKTLAAPSFGMGVTAWKFAVPFIDFTAYDTGKAFATVGSVSSQAEASTWSFNGGVRLVAGKSKVRPYAQFGGGVLHQDLKATFTSGSQSSTSNGSASIGSFMYGGGVQLFVGRKWGSDIGFDGFYVTQPLSALTDTGQNYSRIRIGLFYQTKSAIQ